MDLRLIDSPLKKKFWAQWSIKGNMMTLYCNIEGTITVDFFEKGITVNGTSNYQHLGH